MMLLVTGLSVALASCGRSQVAPAEKHVLLARKEGPVDLAAEGIDVKPFQDVTDDPALIKIPAEGPPASVVKATKQGDKEVLEWEGRKVFEAAAIGRIRGMPTADGVIAFEAITVPGGKPFRSREESAIQKGTPWEVWVVRGIVKAERVSPPGVHATQPVISSDGRHVAFIVEPLHQEANGLSLGIAELVIKDFQEGTVRTHGEKRHGSDYHIAPVDWVKEGGTLTLRVLEDWGETGGHLTLKQVRVE